MKFTFLGILLFSTFSLFAQPTQIVRGTVFDSETNLELIGVRIEIIGSDSTRAYKTQTDLEGMFVLKQIPVGKYQLSSKIASYDFKTTSIIVESGKETVLEIPLSESFVQAQEVIITSRKKNEVINEMALISTQKFSVEETNRYAGSRGDPARMASNFAGVQGADDSRNDIVIRGNSPLGVVYKIEGIDIPNPSHFSVAGSTGGPVSIINNKSLGNSDFFMSAFPAQYGNSISGIFDLKLRNGNMNTNEFTGQFGFLGTEMMAEGPMGGNKKASYIIMGRYSTLSLFEKMNIQIGTDAVPVYADVSFKFNWQLKKGGSLSFFGLGGKSDIAIKISEQKKYSPEFYGEGDRDQYFGTTMGTSGLAYKKTVSEKTFVTATLAISYEGQHSNHNLLDRHINADSTITVDSIKALMAYDYQAIKTSAYFSVNHKINKTHILKAGINIDGYVLNQRDSIRVIDSTASNYNTFIDRWNFKGTALLIQPFIQWKWRMSENTDFTAGLHSQYFTLSNSLSAVEPRLGWKMRLNKDQSVFAGAGLHSQTQPLYTYSYHLSNTTELHNKNMDFTKSIHTGVGYEKSFKNKLNIRTEAYYQYVYNIPVTVQPSSFSLVNMGSGFARFFPDSLQNTGTATNYGLELTFQKYFDKSFFFMFSGTLYDSKYTGSDNIERNTSYNGHYIANVLAGKEFNISPKQMISLGLKVAYAGGKRTGIVDLEKTRNLQEIVFIDSAFNEIQFKDYFRLDFKINWKYNANKATHEIGLDLVNLLNTRNLLSLAYAPNLADPAAIPVAEKTQLGFLPLFYYKIDFKIKSKKED